MVAIHSERRVGGGGALGQRRLVHEKWEIVQVGAGMTQRVPHIGKSLGKEGGGWQAIRAKTTCPRKVGNFAERGWDDTECAKSLG